MTSPVTDDEKPVRSAPFSSRIANARRRGWRGSFPPLVVRAAIMLQALPARAMLPRALRLSIIAKCLRARFEIFASALQISVIMLAAGAAGTKAMSLLWIGRRCPRRGLHAAGRCGSQASPIPRSSPRRWVPVMMRT